MEIFITVVLSIVLGLIGIKLLISAFNDEYLELKESGSDETGTAEERAEVDTDQ